ncbi:hypothetical protein HPSSW114_0351 [Glaesserella parasuis SW114]|nr:hypothetical protein HPSSW114_0351 [Glaesserella parasuis SW114]
MPPMKTTLFVQAPIKSAFGFQEKVTLWGLSGGIININKFDL